PDFTGKRALEALKAKGLARKLFGFAAIAPGPVARQGATVRDASGKPIGVITSGTFSPTLNKPIALGFIDNNHWDLKIVELEMNGRRLQAKVSALPFYKRPV
ncbi:MAG: glycine cleavage T C-terminal barrel domain-containing protein, partial [Elusimicrobiota bacterium]